MEVSHLLGFEWLDETKFHILDCKDLGKKDVNSCQRLQSQSNVVTPPISKLIFNHAKRFYHNLSLVVRSKAIFLVKNIFLVKMAIVVPLIIYAFSIHDRMLRG